VAGGAGAAGRLWPSLACPWFVIVGCVARKELLEARNDTLIQNLATSSSTNRGGSMAGALSITL
jgi:hypothetical protein